MSEEMKEPMQTDNDCKTEEAAASTTETMADYEDHFDDANPWNLVTKYMEEKTVLPVKVEGVVNGGVIVMIEGLRGFVPASKLSLSYIEDLETYLLKEIEVQVIDADQANNRLVLSARELLKEKEKKAREDQIANLKIGEVLEGTVETLQNYGAFIKLDNGLSGLVHVSQISQKRVKLPSDVLNAGDKVTVKVIGIKDGKISLSMKALEEVKEEPTEKVVIPKSENIGTNLGDLFEKYSIINHISYLQRYRRQRICLKNSLPPVPLYCHNLVFFTASAFLSEISPRTSKKLTPAHIYSPVSLPMRFYCLYGI